MRAVDVLILGGGYAGVMAANRLAAHGIASTLVTPRPYFVERIRLHQVAAGSRASARVPLRGLLHENVRVLTGAATRIDAASRTVVWGEAERITYRTLVIAIGSGARHPRRRTDDPALGSPELPYTVNDEEGALRLRAALANDPSVGVTVVGAGFTGIEIACALATTGRSVSVTARATSWNPAIRRRLDALGVRVNSAHADAISVDATGFHVPRLAQDSGLSVDADGRLLVHPDLSVIGHPEIFAGGDIVSLPSTAWPHLRPACATAMPLGAHVADAIIARQDGRATPPFTLGYVGQCVDLGRGTGLLQFVTPDDHPRRLALGHWLGGISKELINRYTLFSLRPSTGAGRYRWRTHTGVPDALARVP